MQGVGIFTEITVVSTSPCHFCTCGAAPLLPAPLQGSENKIIYFLFFLQFTFIRLLILKIRSETVIHVL